MREQTDNSVDDRPGQVTDIKQFKRLLIELLDEGGITEEIRRVKCATVEFLFNDKDIEIVVSNKQPLFYSLKSGRRYSRLAKTDIYPNGERMITLYPKVIFRYNNTVDDLREHLRCILPHELLHCLGWSDKKINDFIEAKKISISR